VTASGSIILSVETSNLKHTRDKTSWRAGKQLRLLIKFCFHLSQIHALAYALEALCHQLAAELPCMLKVEKTNLTANAGSMHHQPDQVFKQELRQHE